MLYVKKFFGDIFYVPCQSVTHVVLCCSYANVQLFSLTQEATQAENALIMENGTHAEEASADDLTVMLFFLKLSLPVMFSLSL